MVSPGKVAASLLLALLAGRGSGAAAQDAKRSDPDRRTPAGARVVSREDTAEEESEAEERALLEGRIEWFVTHRRGPDGVIPRGARGKALSQLQKNLATGLLRSTQELVPGTVWVPIGPAPLIGGSVAYSGRLTSVAVHPATPSTLYIGGAQGGVWKSTDAGATWTPLTDTQPSIAIGSLAIDPSNPATIYAGTGEASGSCDSYFGSGILKSTDGGASWSVLGSSIFNRTSVSRILVHPTNPNILWAANTLGVAGLIAETCYPVVGTYGVWKSEDGGGSWAKVLGSEQTGNFAETQDLILDPSNPLILDAGVSDRGVFKTLNGGLTWTLLGGGLPVSGLARVDLGIHPASPSILYAAIEDALTGGVLGVYKTANGGATWTSAGTPPASLCSSYCYYCLTIEVAPDGAVWLGGINLWRSINAGSTWTSVTNSGLHADQHALLFSVGTAWAANDGGIFSSANSGASWVSRNVGLGTIQFYPGASLHPGTTKLALGGTQDNSTAKFTGTTTWNRLYGGDGAYTAIDFTNPDSVWYVSSQRLNIQKTTNGGSFLSATAGLSDANTAEAPFIAPYVMCPGNASVLIAGSDNVWRTANAATNWTSNSADPLASSGSKIAALAFAPSDTSCNTYFAGTLDGGLYRTTTGGGSVGWTKIATGLPGTALSDIAVHPTNPEIVYASFSGFGVRHLFKSVNALAASPIWTASDTGVPDTPALAVLVDPTEPSVVYLGTDIGIFRSTDAGASWALFMNGHPNVAVYDLVASPAGNTIVSFTHGRGAFRLTPLHASQTAASAIDLCPSGGAGSGDGVIDPGETITMPVTILNDGPGGLTNVTGVLSSPTSGVEMLDDAATWPSLPVGGSSSTNPDHFSYRVASSTPCGSSIDFDLGISYDQGSNPAAFSATVGVAPGGPSGLLSEAFPLSLPAGWAIMDGGSFGGIARSWTTGNPCSRTVGAPFSGSFEIVDSACAGASATQDESLVTPTIDASACGSVELQFDNQLHWKFGSLDEKADVDVSTNGGSVWTNVLRMQGIDDGYPTPNTKIVDLSAVAGGQPAFKIRFHYYSGRNEYWWAIDNVHVICRSYVCRLCVGPPPGEAGMSPPLLVDKSGSGLDLSWGAVSGGCGGADYAVYEGSLASLHLGLYDHAPLACTTGGSTSRMIGMTASPGSYFLVTATATVEEGSYGKKSDGTERPRATAACKAVGNTLSCP